MGDHSLKPVESGHVGHSGNAVVSGGDDDDSRIQRSGISLHRKVIVLAKDALDVHAQSWRDTVLARVGVKVVEHLRARRVSRRGFGPRSHWQARVALDGVKMKAVIVTAPTRSQRDFPFDHGVRHVPMVQTGGDSKARRPCAYHQDVVGVHDRSFWQRWHQAQITEPVDAYQRSSSGATAASTLDRRIFMVGVSRPFSIVSGVRAMTIIFKR